MVPAIVFFLSVFIHKNEKVENYMWKIKSISDIIDEVIVGGDVPRDF